MLLPFGELYPRIEAVPGYQGLTAVADIFRLLQQLRKKRERVSGPFFVPRNNSFFWRSSFLQVAILRYFQTFCPILTFITINPRDGEIQREGDVYTFALFHYATAGFLFRL